MQLLVPNAARQRRRRVAAAFLSLAAAAAFLLSSPDGDGGAVGNVRGPAQNGWIRRALAAADKEKKRDYDDNGRDGLRILALGGSVTWGAQLENRHDAYPYVLGRHPSVSRTDNLAIRATGSEYPTSCIQSMIRSAFEDDPDGTWGDDPDPDYDVILLEFSLNGRDGLPLLMARLRRRYPDAVIVYVSLYSAKKNHKRRFMPRKDWTSIVGPGAADVVPPPDRIYHLPLRDDPRENEAAANRTRKLYFANDEFHLSEGGHSVVALDIFSLLQSLGPPARPPRRGSWGGGDKCVSWFSTGKVLPEAELSGGTVEEFAEGKFAYEVPKQMPTEAKGAGMPKAVTLEVENRGSAPTPLYLDHMTRGDPCQYPKLEVRLRPAPLDGDGSVSASTEKSDGGTTLELDPANKDITGKIWGGVHITRSSYAGLVPSGSRAQLTVRPVERTDLPFRIVGYSMCAACEEMRGYLGNGKPAVSSARI